MPTHTDATHTLPFEMLNGREEVGTNNLPTPNTLNISLHLLSPLFRRHIIYVPSLSTEEIWEQDLESALLCQVVGSLLGVWMDAEDIYL